MKVGGFGSGRPRGSGRRQVEACRTLDVNQLHQAGCLHPGWTGIGQWSDGVAADNAISLKAEPDRLHLSCRIRVDDAWENVTETVSIIQVSCRFGGTGRISSAPAW
jgi:hypothetical protein